MELASAENEKLHEDKIGVSELVLESARPHVKIFCILISVWGEWQPQTGSSPASS